MNYRAFIGTIALSLCISMQAHAQDEIDLDARLAVVSAIREAGCATAPADTPALAMAAGVTEAAYADILKDLASRGLVSENAAAGVDLTQGLCGVSQTTPRFVVIAALRLNDCVMDGAAAEAQLPAYGLTQEVAMAALRELADEGSLLPDGEMMVLDEEMCTVRISQAAGIDPAEARAAMLATAYKFNCVVPAFEIDFDLRRLGLAQATIAQMLADVVASGEAVNDNSTLTFAPDVCAQGARVEDMAAEVLSGQAAQDMLSGTDVLAFEDAVLVAIENMGCVMDLTDEAALTVAVVSGTKVVLGLSPEPDAAVDSVVDKRVGAALTEMQGLFDVDPSAGTATLRGCTP